MITKPASRVVPDSARFASIKNDRRKNSITYTTWHITWGTYGTRLHGGHAPTVDRNQNKPGEAFVYHDPERLKLMESRLSFPPVYLTEQQRIHIQDQLPAICERGGWLFRIAAAETDHVHILLDIPKQIHGNRVRQLMKRWVTQALNEKWPPGSGEPGSLPRDARWWAIKGSCKPVKADQYLQNVTAYISRQRCSSST